MNFPGHIEGISDERRFTRGGRLSIGEKLKGTRPDGTEYTYPAKLDHFRLIPDLQLATKTAVLEEWAEAYGPAPKAIQVMLPGAVRAAVFPQAYKAWKGGKLWCIGDNVQAQRRTEDWSSWAPVPCSDACPFRVLSGVDDRARTCKPEGTLHVLLPDLPSAGTAVFTLRCSRSAIVRLNSDLDQAHMMLGDLTLREMRLRLRSENTTVKGKKTTIYVPELELPRIPLRELAAARATPALRAHVDDELPPEDVDPDGLEDLDPDYAPPTSPPPTEAAPPAPRRDHRAPPAGPPSDDDPEALALYRRIMQAIGQRPGPERREWSEKANEARGDVRELSEVLEALKSLAPATQ